MNVAVRYLAQLRRLAGRPGDSLSMASPCTVADVVQRIAAADASLRPTLLDEGGEVRASLLIFVGDEQADRSRMLREGDEVTLMTPIAGGAR